jgi:hypothetical protein
LLFIFINKVQAEEKTVRFADFSKNEIMLSEENYLVVGNIENDFNSIKYFADNYCSDKLGNNYMSSSIQISINVAYAFCQKVDQLYEYNFTESERSCFNKFDISLDTLYNRECLKIIRDFESISAEVKGYREKIKILNSDAFIYEILNENLSKKILDFETKILLSKKTQELNQKLATLQQELKQKLATLENPIIEQIDTIMVKRNIKLCKLYEFVEGSELYYKCILILMENQKNNRLIDADL